MYENVLKLLLFVILKYEPVLIFIPRVYISTQSYQDLVKANGMFFVTHSVLSKAKMCQNVSKLFCHGPKSKGGWYSHFRVNFAKMCQFYSVFIYVVYGTSLSIILSGDIHSSTDSTPIYRSCY